MRIGSLFSGIGGLELGLEGAGLGYTVWQVEQDAFCRSVLAKRWPDAERFEDVREVGARNLAPVDLVCGGFPCQDLSSAGARKGLVGKRSGLWFEFARIVGELKPQWVVVENVTSGAKMWVDAVRADLGQRGYETLPVPMQADWLGAPYPRARIFVIAWRVAHTDREGQSAESFDGQVAGKRALDGVAAAPRQASDADSDELRQQRRGISGPDGQETAQPLRNRWCEPMPRVDGMVSRVSGRVAAQRALGNAVVPQCAEVIGHMIQELRGT